MSAQPRFGLELSCGSRPLGNVGPGGGAVALQAGGCREPGNHAQDEVYSSDAMVLEQWFSASLVL